jgi:hypothetical protein
VSKLIGNGIEIGIGIRRDIAAGTGTWTGVLRGIVVYVLSWV